MLDKKIVFVLAIIFVVFVGLFILSYFDSSDAVDIDENTDRFDYTSKPVTVWDSSSHEFKFHQIITSKYNQSFDNISIDVIFYNHGKIIGIQSSDIDEIDDGSFDLDFSIKLDSQPTSFIYNVPYVNWT